MKLSELKDKKIEDLKHLLVDSSVKLQDLNFKVANNQLKNVRELRQVKKLIARINTIINERNDK